MSGNRKPAGLGCPWLEALERMARKGVPVLLATGAATKFIPQSAQNLAPVSFSAPHSGHLIIKLLINTARVRHVLYSTDRRIP